MRWTRAIARQHAAGEFGTHASGVAGGIIALRPWRRFARPLSMR
jgi:hypothetical protein